MFELVRITPENAVAFEHLIREDVFLYVTDHATVSIGITEDGMPIAALLFRIEDDASSEILSICVDVPYRRQGIATELLARAADYLAQETECGRFTCKFDVRTDLEDTFTGFLEYLGFTITCVPGGCFVTSLGELRKVRELEGNGTSCTPYGKLTTMQKKQLCEMADISDLMDAGTIEENMSCVIYDDKKITGCLIFTADEEDPESLNVAWTENLGNPADMLYMMRSALHAAAYADDKKIYIPVLNERSERLVEKLMKGHATRCEKSYEAQLELFSEESEEAWESA